MKSVLVLLTTSFVLAASGALAQSKQQADACSKRYGACMDHCSSRPQSVQATCSQSCEASTNQCYVGVYGPLQQNNATAAAPQAPQAAPAAAAVPEQARDAQGRAVPVDNSDK